MEATTSSMFINRMEMFSATETQTSLDITVQTAVTLLSVCIMNETDSQSSKTSDLYSGGCRFESQPESGYGNGHLPFSPGKWQSSTSK
jgi:hypothetical protein